MSGRIATRPMKLYILYLFFVGNIDNVNKHDQFY